MAEQTRGRVVVGVDGSRTSRRALRAAVAEAALCDGSVDAVFFWSMTGIPRPKLDAGPTYVPSTAEWQASAQQIVDKAVAEALAGPEPPTDVPVTPRAVHGGPRKLLDQAVGAELLVVGARGTSGLERWVLGTVSRQMVEQTPCPVLVVRDRTSAPGGGEVIVGVDGSPGSDRALDWALRRASASRAPVHAVRTWAPLRMPVLKAVGWSASQGGEVQGRHEQEEAQGQLDRALERRPLPPGVAAHASALEGSPAGRLVEAAAGAELLVVGSRGMGGFARMLMGSVSTQCAEHATCPVVVVPSERRGAG